MAQETATILGGELGKILSGQEFAGLDLEESIDRVLETGAQTAGTMAVFFLPGAAMNTVSGVRHAKVMQKGTEGAQGESFGQPVNPEVNLGQKVPILDLSGKIPDAQRATPQELLDFLKAEFVGKEPSISADGEAMIGLPSNSAAKHVVRSSWKGLTYEDMDTRTAGLMSLRDMLQNATRIESSPNQKSSKTHLKNLSGDIGRRRGSRDRPQYVDGGISVQERSAQHLPELYGIWEASGIWGDPIPCRTGSLRQGARASF